LHDARIGTNLRRPPKNAAISLTYVHVIQALWICLEEEQHLASEILEPETNEPSGCQKEVNTFCSPQTIEFGFSRSGLHHT
jgi:hypothetical protein